MLLIGMKNMQIINNNLNTQFNGKIYLIDKRHIKSGKEVIKKGLSFAEDKLLYDAHKKVSGEIHHREDSAGGYGVSKANFVEYLDQINKILGIDKSVLNFDKSKEYILVGYNVYTEQNGRRYYKIDLNSRYSIAHELNLKDINENEALYAIF